MRLHILSSQNIAWPHSSNTLRFAWSFHLRMELGWILWFLLKLVLALPLFSPPEFFNLKSSELYLLYLRILLCFKLSQLFPAKGEECWRDHIDHLLTYANEHCHYDWLRHSSLRTSTANSWFKRGQEAIL